MRKWTRKMSKLWVLVTGIKLLIYFRWVQHFVCELQKQLFAMWCTMYGILLMECTHSTRLKVSTHNTLVGVYFLCETFWVFAKEEMLLNAHVWRSRVKNQTTQNAAFQLNNSVFCIIGLTENGSCYFVRKVCVCWGSQLLTYIVV